jgi:SPX domain protein involved in polyphosphate accumulation
MAWISSYMAFCHAKERLASWKVDGSWADKEESHGVEVTPNEEMMHGAPLSKTC